MDYEDSIEGKMLMSKETDLLSWIPEGRRTQASVVAWWETRRLLYNIIVFLVYHVSIILALFILALFPEPPESPKPDFDNEITIFSFLFCSILAGIFFNICYIAGWVIDGLLPEKYGNSAGKRPLCLWIAGIVFSVALCLFPAVLNSIMLLFYIISKS